MSLIDSDRLKLDLPLLLPQVPDAADSCVHRLIGLLEAQDGIDKVHVEQPEDGPALLCIHHDRNRISLPRIRQLAQSAGAQITRRIGHQIWHTDSSFHPRRAAALTAALKGIDGVLEAGVSASGVIRIEHDRELLPEAELERQLRTLAPGRLQLQAGPEAVMPSEEEDHGHDHDHTHLFGQHEELIFAIMAGFFLLVAFVIDKAWADAPRFLPMAGYGLAYVLGGVFSLREAWISLRRRRFEIDTLMLVAAAGAAALGAWAEGALLLFLFSLGHALEHGAMHRMQSAISGLSTLLPDTANLQTANGLQEIAADRLLPGDIIVVKPHERVAADGFILSGSTSIDQSSITGESMPADKIAVADAVAARLKPQRIDTQAQVFAGTINGQGLIEVEVTRPAGQSTLTRAVQLINEAETYQSKTERFSARIERIFVPSVLVLAGLLMFAWLVIDEPFSASFYRSMAVLVAASPCALAISTPSAVLSGVARAAQGGVLVKGGGPLEQLATVRTLAFDKTGTLTEGKPRIRSVQPAEGVAEAELLRMAIAVEGLSEHPLARAVVTDGLQRLQDMAADTSLPEVSDLEDLPGHGLSARVEGEIVEVGRLESVIDAAAPGGEALLQEASTRREQGQTVVAVRRGSRNLGIIGLQDRPRPEAAGAIRDLRALSIGQMIMLSGDSQPVASAVAAELGLDSAQGDLLPEDKLRTIRELRTEGGIAMIGDGVNDAPAMANASVGVAMGAAGSDLALETADLALLGDNLANLPFAVSLSRRVQAITRQNLWISLGVVALLVPATIMGLRIGPAVVLHEGSTLVVVLNALRLLAHPVRKKSRG